MASLSIFVFLSTWNDFLQPLVFLRSQENFTVQLWLSFVSRVNNVGQPAIVMAGSVLASIPIVIMFALLQRHFIAGLTAGSKSKPLPARCSFKEVLVSSSSIAVQSERLAIDGGEVGAHPTGPTDVSRRQPDRGRGGGGRTGGPTQQTAVPLLRSRAGALEGAEFERAFAAHMGCPTRWRSAPARRR